MVLFDLCVSLLLRKYDHGLSKGLLGRIKFWGHHLNLIFKLRDFNSCLSQHFQAFHESLLGLADRDPLLLEDQLVHVQ